jgi:predicted DNA binding CopG/RHH family protein
VQDASEKMKMVNAARQARRMAKLKKQSLCRIEIHLENSFVNKLRNRCEKLGMPLNKYLAEFVTKSLDT